MHELLGSDDVRQWLRWTGSQQSLLHSSALGKLLQVRYHPASVRIANAARDMCVNKQESAAVLLKMNVPVHLSGAVAVDGANVIRISRGAMERMDNRACRSSAMPQSSDM